MTERLHLLLIFLATLIVASCSQGKQTFTLNVHVEGKPPGVVLLEEFGAQITLLDSTQSDDKGSLTFTGSYDEPSLYRLRMDDQNLFFVIDGSQIDIQTTWKEPNLYTASGSLGSASLSAFLKGYMSSLKDLVAMQYVLDSLDNEVVDDSLLFAAQLEEERQVSELQNYIKAFSDTTSSMPAVLFATQLLNFNNEVAYFTSLADGLTSRFPNSDMAKDFAAKLREKAESVPKVSNRPSVGMQAPDFSLPGVDGHTMISLSSFKGQYVLLDFWASWCPPCRAENPAVVSAFNKYKDRNFTIFGVSLDHDADKWQEAIAVDGLTWTHVSDLKGWQSTAATLYALESIPANFLIDPKGKIIATDLRGAELERTLQEVFNPIVQTADASTEELSGTSLTK